MGPTRLRRGYSLEVIFEEDSDFCSHLDSLDSTRAPGSNHQHELNQISLDSLVVEEVEEEEDDQDVDFLEDSSPGPFASFDQVFDIRDMESCLVEWQEPRPKPDGDQDRGLEIDDGRQSRVSRRQILQSTWLLHDDTEERSEAEEEELIVPQLTSSIPVPHHTDSDSDSTLTDDTDTHTYAFADAHDELISIASSATLDSESLQPVYNPEEEVEGNSPQEEQEMDLTAEALALDVKRVREIFEQRQIYGRNPTTATKETSPQQSLQLLAAPNLPPRNPGPLLDSGVNSKSSVLSTKWMNSKSPLSQSSTHLNQLASYDLVDLLVNDRVVIEDSPDIFQTVRSTTNKSAPKKRSSQESAPTLRRCKSMSTGIFSPESPCNATTTADYPVSRQSCILAEEMPAPNLVKNVRNVFERLCSSQRNNSSKCDVESDRSRKAPLRSIKSNPTSKILRSESLRDDNNNNNGSDVKKLREKEKLFSSSALSPTKKKSSSGSSSSSSSSGIAPSNSNSNKTRASRTAESSNSDDDELKYIPADVLSRIRSHGTTTTYFGGEIVAKTIKNRKLLVPNNLIPTGNGSIGSNSTTPDLHYNHLMELLPESRSPVVGREVIVMPGLDLGPAGTSSTTIPSPFDSTPRIVNVFPKSPWSKNTSPNGSLTTSGRNSPEGCESQEPVSELQHQQQQSPLAEVGIIVEGMKVRDSNNNHHAASLRSDSGERKFSEINEGAWF